jgi:iron(III) transport system ATP-binding protein
VLAHVPSHHDHKIGEWIGIRAEVDHVVTFTRTCPVTGGDLCQLPCAFDAQCDKSRLPEPFTAPSPE